MNLKSFSLRWLWLAAGIVAIIVLTAFNVYLLNQLQNNSTESIRQSKILQVAEFADRTRHRFFHPFHGFGSLNMKKIEQIFQQTGHFTDKMIKVVEQASADSIFKSIYYIPAASNACYENSSILKYESGQNAFTSTRDYGAVICDGLGMARTRMKALIEGYQFNNKVLFDTHRSMTIALVNLNSQSVVGFLVMPINITFLVEQYLQPQLVKAFGGADNNGISVWLRYWTKQKVLARSDTNIAYNADLIQYIHQFPDFFDDWRLYVAMNESLLQQSKSSSLLLNVVVLSVAFALLVGAFVFMFITAQRERNLAERQSSFLANVTHELKTPLAVMQAAGENLSDGRIKNKQRLQKYGTHIYSEALRLHQMIEKLLDVAKADAGKSFIKPEPRSISSLLIKFIDEHRQYIEGEGFTLDVSIQDKVPQALVDEHSFYTVLNNLVNNAIKYSFGKKFLGIYLTYSEKNIILEIEDHGVGMEPNSLDHIFEKFYRVEDTLTAQTEGYGLGLSIVKNLIELNKGTIDVQSERGSGTIFTITLPAITER